MFSVWLPVVGAPVSSTLITLPVPANARLWLPHVKMLYVLAPDCPSRVSVSPELIPFMGWSSLTVNVSLPSPSGANVLCPAAEAGVGWLDPYTRARPFSCVCWKMN